MSSATAMFEEYLHRSAVVGPGVLLEVSVDDVNFGQRSGVEASQ